MKGGRSFRSLLFGAVTAFVVLAAGFHVASAAREMNYIPIEEVPGFEGQSPDFLTYLRNIFVMLVWIVGIGGMFMIALGGFWYITSAGNNARVLQAKRLIWDAIVGLALVLTAWLILHTINPDLVIFRFQSLDWSGTSSTAPQPAPGTGGNTGNGSVPQDMKTAAQEVLDNCTVSSAADSCGGTAKKDLTDLAAGNPMTISCTGQQKTPPLQLVQMLSQLCKTNGSQITVNVFGGGKHSDGSLHYQGRAVDLGISGRNFSDLLQKTNAAASAVGMSTGGIFCDNGKRASCSVANHVHAGL